MDQKRQIIFFWEKSKGDITSHTEAKESTLIRKTTERSIAIDNETEQLHLSS